MSTTYTGSLRFTQQPVGGNLNTWGNILNGVLDLVEDSIAGYLNISITGSGGTYTLTTANGSSDESRNMILRATGTPTTNWNIVVPTVTKMYIVENNASANYNIVVKTSSGSGVTIPQNQRAVVYCDGVDVREIVIGGSQAIPSGFIGMWSGTVASIPSGWVLCNGSSGTPDLRDRFIVGARQDDGGVAKTNITGSLTQTGGGTTGTTSSSGAHTHTGTTGSYTLTTADIPNHTHTLANSGSTGSSMTGTQYLSSFGNYGSSNNYILGGTASAPDIGKVAETGGGGAHSHTISSDGAHTHTVDILPTYYALAFIMKT